MGKLGRELPASPQEPEEVQSGHIYAKRSMEAPRGRRKHFGKNNERNQRNGREPQKPKEGHLI